MKNVAVEPYESPRTAQEHSGIPPVYAGSTPYSLSGNRHIRFRKNLALAEETSLQFDSVDVIKSALKHYRSLHGSLIGALIVAVITWYASALCATDP